MICEGDGNCVCVGWELWGFYEFEMYSDLLEEILIFVFIVDIVFSNIFIRFFI